MIAVSDDVLHDLRTPLARTRYTMASDTTHWAGGVDPGYLRELVAYWADGFDWLTAEAELNAHPHYLAEIAGRQVHFVHLRARRTEGAPEPLPLILTHGWPSSFVEMLRVARPLADPASHGGDPADAFDVIIPSLPLPVHHPRSAASATSASRTGAGAPSRRSAGCLLGGPSWPGFRLTGGEFRPERGGGPQIHRQWTGVQYSAYFDCPFPLGPG